MLKKTDPKPMIGFPNNPIPLIRNVCSQLFRLLRPKASETERTKNSKVTGKSATRTQ